VRDWIWVRGFAALDGPRRVRGRADGGVPRRRGLPRGGRLCGRLPRAKDPAPRWRKRRTSGKTDGEDGHVQRAVCRPSRLRSRLLALREERGTCLGRPRAPHPLRPPGWTRPLPTGRVHPGRRGVPRQDVHVADAGRRHRCLDLVGEDSDVVEKAPRGLRRRRPSADAR